MQCVLAYSLWKGLEWAWKSSLALAVAGIGFFVFSLFLVPGFGEIVLLIIDLLVLYYLIQPLVQVYFKQQASTPP